MAVKLIGKSKKLGGGIGFVDITFVMLLFMTWVFFANAWKNPLANTMLGVTSVIITFYLIAKYAGVLRFLELTKPFWTITGFMSIPVWYFTFMILPMPGGSFSATDITPNLLDFFISPAIATNILQSWAFALTEGLLAGILLAFFMGVARKRAGTKKKQQTNIVAVILLIAIFMSFIHVSVAVAMAKAGVFEPGILFGHQVLSFGIMLIGAVFFPMVGIVMLLAPHVVKNLIAFNAPTSMWIGIFIIFIVLDLMSWFFAKKKEKQSVRSQVSAFVK